jgi:hypothetical protein
MLGMAPGRGASLTQSCSSFGPLILTRARDILRPVSPLTSKLNFRARRSRPSCVVFAPIQRRRANRVQLHSETGANAT